MNLETITSRPGRVKDRRIRMNQRAFVRMLNDYRLLEYTLLMCTRRRRNRRWCTLLESDSFELKARGSRPKDFQDPLEAGKVSYEYPDGYRGTERVRIFVYFHKRGSVGMLEVFPIRGKYALPGITQQVSKELWIGDIDYVAIVRLSYHRESFHHKPELCLTEATIIRSTPEVDFNRLFRVSKMRDPQP